MRNAEPSSPNHTGRLNREQAQEAASFQPFPGAIPGEPPGYGMLTMTFQEKIGVRCNDL